MVKRQRTQSEHTVKLRSVGGHGAVTADVEQGSLTNVGRLELSHSESLRVIQHFVELLDLCLGGATDTTPACNGRCHCTVKHHSHLLVGGVLHTHGEATACTQDAVKLSQASVLTGTIVEQAEEPSLELFGTVERVTHNITHPLACFGKAVWHTTKGVSHQVDSGVVSTQGSCQGEATSTIGVEATFEGVDARSHGTGVEERSRVTVADVAARLVNPVACSVISELNAQLVEGTLDGVEDACDQTHVQFSSEVSQIFFDSLGLAQTTGLDGGIGTIAHCLALVVDVVHQGVELLGRDEAAQTEVTQCLVGQHEVQLIFSGDAVSEDDDIVITERVAHSLGCVEVTLRACSRSAAIEFRTLGLEVSLVLVDEHTGLDGQAAQELVDSEAHTAHDHGGSNGLTIRSHVATRVNVISPVVQERTLVGLGLTLCSSTALLTGNVFDGLDISRSHLLIADAQLTVDHVGDGLAALVEERRQWFTQQGILLSRVEVGVTHLFPHAGQIVDDLGASGSVGCHWTLVEFVDLVSQLDSRAELGCRTSSLFWCDCRLERLDHRVRQVVCGDETTVEQDLRLCFGQPEELHIHTRQTLEHTRGVLSQCVPWRDHTLGVGLQTLTFCQHDERISHDLALCIGQVGGFQERLGLSDALDLELVTGREERSLDHTTGVAHGIHELVAIPDTDGLVSQSHVVVEPLSLRHGQHIVSKLFEDNHLRSAAAV